MTSPPLLADVEAAIWSWRPRLVASAEAAFARRVVVACRPKSPARARTLLWATSRLAAFGASVGLPCSEDQLFRPGVIERFVMVGLKDLSGSRRQSLRTNLRFVGRRVSPKQFPPDPVPLSRQRSSRPYSEIEIASYLALAAAQPTEARRMRASGLVCLGAGAGLVGADLRQVRGSDIEGVSGICCVHVRGLRPRLVPVLEAYEETLRASAAFAGDGYVLGGVRPERHNVTHRLVDSLSGGRDLPRLSLPRLRASYLSLLLSAAGLPEVLAAAGLSDSKALFDLVSYLGPPGEDRVLAVVGELCGTKPS